VQTPQAFAHVALRRAHEATSEATDDAALIEALGLEVAVVPGEAANAKLTAASDLETMALALARTATGGAR
jgi:2-C-methyl-D-erythritol 4-phosphate cytidylyltransferase